MRIDVTQITAKPQIQGQVVTNEFAGFKKGDIVKATVVSADGDKATFKTEDGKLFNAKLSSDIVNLMPDDSVEFVVTSSHENKVSIQLVSHEHGSLGAEAAAAREQAMLSGLPPDKALEIISALRDMGVEPNKALLTEATKIFIEAQLDAKAAAFLAANGIPATEEFVQALVQLKNGQTTGAILQDALQQAALEQPVVEQPGAQRVIEGEANINHAGVMEDAALLNVKGGEDGHIVKAESPKTQEANSNKLNTLQNTAQGAKTPGAKNQIQQSGKGQHSSAQSTQAAKTADAKPHAQALFAALDHHVALQETAQMNSNAVAGNPVAVAETTAELANVIEKLLGMFTQINDETDGQQLKKAAEETPLRLETLKDMIDSTGGKSKAVAARLTDAAAQVKLTHDVQRFYCVHIPVKHQSHDTAELYIYKNKKGGKGIDPENTSILIGLETANMGRVESLIRVDKRNISLVFGVENEYAAPILKEGSRELYPLLKQRNYNLIDVKAHKLEKPTTIDTAEERLVNALNRPQAYIDFKV